jgi:hypothetical protein
MCVGVKLELDHFLPRHLIYLSDQFQAPATLSPRRSRETL